MQSTRIIMLRHGETIWNTECRLQGRNDSPLTENGIRQAEGLREYLRDVRVDACYSSPLGRAFETARIALADKGREIIQLAALSELDLGEWEGRQIEELAACYPTEYNLFLQGSCGAESVGGESLPQLADRMYGVLQEVVAKHNGGCVVIVAHGMILRTVLCVLAGKTVNSRAYKQSNGSVNIVEYDGQNWQIVLQNHVPFAGSVMQYSGKAAIFQ